MPVTYNYPRLRQQSMRHTPDALPPSISRSPRWEPSAYSIGQASLALARRPTCGRLLRNADHAGRDALSIMEGGESRRTDAAVTQYADVLAQNAQPAGFHPE